MFRRSFCVTFLWGQDLSFCVPPRTPFLHHTEATLNPIDSTERVGSRETSPTPHSLDQPIDITRDGEGGRRGGSAQRTVRLPPPSCAAVQSRHQKEFPTYAGLQYGVVRYADPLERTSSHSERKSKKEEERKFNTAVEASSTSTWRSIASSLYVENVSEAVPLHRLTPFTRKEVVQWLEDQQQHEKDHEASTASSSHAAGVRDEVLGTLRHLLASFFPSPPPSQSHTLPSPTGTLNRDICTSSLSVSPWCGVTQAEAVQSGVPITAVRAAWDVVERRYRHALAQLTQEHSSTPHCHNSATTHRSLNEDREMEVTKEGVREQCAIDQGDLSASYAYLVLSPGCFSVAYGLLGVLEALMDIWKSSSSPFSFVSRSARTPSAAASACGVVADRVEGAKEGISCPLKPEMRCEWSRRAPRILWCPAPNASLSALWVIHALTSPATRTKESETPVATHSRCSFDAACGLLDVLLTRGVEQDIIPALCEAMRIPPTTGHAMRKMRNDEFTTRANDATRSTEEARQEARATAPSSFLTVISSGCSTRAVQSWQHQLFKERRLPSLAPHRHEKMPSSSSSNAIQSERATKETTNPIQTEATPCRITSHPNALQASVVLHCRTPRSPPQNTNHSSLLGTNIRSPQDKASTASAYRSHARTPPSLIESRPEKNSSNGRPPHAEPEGVRKAKDNTEEEGGLVLERLTAPARLGAAPLLSEQVFFLTRPTQTDVGNQSDALVEVAGRDEKGVRWKSVHVHVPLVGVITSPTTEPEKELGHGGVEKSSTAKTPHKRAVHQGENGELLTGKTTPISFPAVESSSGCPLAEWVAFHGCMPLFPPQGDARCRTTTAFTSPMNVVRDGGCGLHHRMPLLVLPLERLLPSTTSTTSLLSHLVPLLSACYGHSLERLARVGHDEGTFGPHACSTSRRQWRNLMHMGPCAGVMAQYAAEHYWLQDLLRRPSAKQLKEKKRRTVRWQHVSGGFTPPLTCSGLSSSKNYFHIPAILLTVIEAPEVHPDNEEEGSVSPPSLEPSPRTHGTDSLKKELSSSPLHATEKKSMASFVSVGATHFEKPFSSSTWKNNNNNNNRDAAAAAHHATVVASLTRQLEAVCEDIVCNVLAPTSDALREDSSGTDGMTSMGPSLFLCAVRGLTLQDSRRPPQERTEEDSLQPSTSLSLAHERCQDKQAHATSMWTDDFIALVDTVWSRTLEQSLGVPF